MIGDEILDAEKKSIVRITQAESKLALCVFAHLKILFEAIGLSRGGVMGPLDMDQADLLLCSASLRALMFDDDAPEPPLITLLERISSDCKIPCLETDINLFFMSDYFGERPHVSDLLLKIIHETFMGRMGSTEKIDTEDSFIVAYMSGKGFESLFKEVEKWLPTIHEYHESGVGVSGTEDGLAPSQVVRFTRKLVPVREWGRVRFGYLKTVPIRRDTIVKYVANQLGGVHYDSRRLPKKGERNEFKLLAEAYDWGNQAVTHAGLVCVAVMSVELLMCKQVRDLLLAISQFLHRREARLKRRFDCDDQDWL